MVKKKSIKRKEIGLFLLSLGAIFLLNFVANKKYFRLDLTQDKRFTLTDATKSVITKLNDVVEFKVYLHGNNLPVKYVEFKEEIQNRLTEIRNLNPNNIEFEFIDPYAAEDPAEFVKSLRKQGLRFTNDVEKTENGVNQIQVIPGMMIYYKGKSLPVNLLKSDITKSIESIEYELVSTIKILSNGSKNRKNVGLLQGHGELFPEEIGDLSSEIIKFYNPALIRLRDSTGKLDVSNLFQSDILIIAKPVAPFSQDEVFAIDQYVMRGGKIIWMLDQVAADEDSLRDKNFFIANINHFNIEDLLYNYGVRVNANVVQDMQCSLINAQVGVEANGEKKNQVIPWFYSPIVSSLNNHIINYNLDPVKMNFANTIDTIPSPGVTKTVLLTTSMNTKIVKAPVRVGIDFSVNALQNGVDKKLFNEHGKPLAVLLEGNFSSYFKNRIVDPNIQVIKRSVENKMLVISDGDLARNKINPYDGRVEPLGMDKFLRYQFDNKKFLLNALNYLSGDEDMIPARCKRIQMRLLDKGKIKENKKMIQIVNVGSPVVVIILFGIVYTFIRRRKYTKA